MKAKTYSVVRDYSDGYVGRVYVAIRTGFRSREAAAQWIANTFGGWSQEDLTIHQSGWRQRMAARRG